MVVRIVGYAADGNNPPLAPVTIVMDCRICGEPLACRWTDSFGIGACLCCGAPYKILPRDQEGQPMTLEEWIPVLKRYWEEKHRNVDPGAYNFPGSSYEVATQVDADSRDSWMEAHKDELPCMTLSG